MGPHPKYGKEMELYTPKVFFSLKEVTVLIEKRAATVSDAHIMGRGSRISIESFLLRTIALFCIYDKMQKVSCMIIFQQIKTSEVKK